MTTKLLLAAGCVVLIAACGGGDDAQSVTTTEEQAVTTTEPEYGSELVPVVEQARADLADRLDVDESSIEVVSAESVTWRDGSLGCPEPGRFYTQALVEGSRITLDYEGDTYLYHADRDGAPFLCPEEQVKDPFTGDS